MYHIIAIHSLDLPDLEVYAHLNENQLRHYFEPEPGVFIAESPNAILRALHAGYEPLSVLMEEKYVGTEGAAILEAISGQQADFGEASPGPGTSGAVILPETGLPVGEGIPVYVSTLDVLCRITGYHLTRGILAAFRRKGLPSAEEVCREARRIAVLDNIENPTNVGAIIRSAAALGMDAVLLTPGCADPLYRRAIRVSVGTVFQIPWTYIGVPERHYTWMKKRNVCNERLLAEDIPADDLPGSADPELNPAEFQKTERTTAGADSVWEQLHSLGFRTAALALEEGAICIDDPGLSAEPKLALVLGNEGEGLPQSTIADCDYVVTIPMANGVDSLNVAAASAVAFWQLRTV